MKEKSANGNELSRGERLQIMLDEGELLALEDFRFANRMPSRAAAVRELLRRGLAINDRGTEHGGACGESVERPRHKSNVQRFR